MGFMTLFPSQVFTTVTTLSCLPTTLQHVNRRLMDTGRPDIGLAVSASKSGRYSKARDRWLP